MSSIILSAQNYVTLPSCCVLLASQQSIRNCIAPRYLASADNLGGLKSLHWQNWNKINPDRLLKFIKLILTAPTVVHTLRVSFPTLCEDSSVISFAKIAIENPRMCFVKNLSVRKCMYVTDAILDYVGQMYNLEKLDFSFTRIGQQTKTNQLISSFSKLKNLRWLRELQLEGCLSITSEHLEGLQDLPRLKWLNVSSTRVQSFDCFADSNNILSSSSGSSIQILELRRMNHSIDLSALGNSLIDLDLTHFAWNYYANVPRNITGMDKVHSLHRLVLSHSGIRNLDFLKDSESLDTLVVVELESCKYLTDISVLGSCGALRRLNLKDCRLKNDDDGGDVGVVDESSSGIDDLQDCINLEYLDLSFNCGIKNVNCLGSLHYLRSLSLSGLSNLKDKGIEGIDSRMSSLLYINMTNCQNISNVNHFGKLDRLALLNLAGCKNVTRKGFDDVIRWSKTLQNLNLLGTAIVSYDDGEDLVGEWQKQLPTLENVLITHISKGSAVDVDVDVDGYQNDEDESVWNLIAG